MNSNLFDASFFGYSNLPESIEVENLKLIPIKALKLKYEAHSMVSSCNSFSVSSIKTICNLLNIQLHRPVKGLYCIEESYSRFFDYLYSHSICNRTEIQNRFQEFSF